MNVAIFGWYHHQNAGDDRIQQCLIRWLDGHTLAFLPSGRKPSLQFLRSYDAVLIGGGGIFMQSGGLVKAMSKWVKKLNKPVAIIGASLESMDAKLVQEIKHFLPESSFAWFRDSGANELLGSHEKLIIAPDLTFLYPFEIISHAPQNMGVAISLRNESGLDAEKWKSVLDDSNQSWVTWPLYFEQGGDRMLLQQIFPNHKIEDAFTIQTLQHCRAVVTGRFHGVLFAIQCGLPFIAVSSRPKMIRFLNEMGWSQWRIDEKSPDLLNEKINDLNKNYDGFRSEILQKRQQLIKQNQNTAKACMDKLHWAVQSNSTNKNKALNKLKDMLDFGSKI